jgi:chloramphenicol O-acetyltransferase
MSSKVKRKPTIKELTNVVLELNDRVNYLYSVISELEKAFSLYVEYKKDDDKFRKYIDKKVKEWKEKNDAEGNGEADKPNLQGDTDGESSRSKGIRKKTK